MTDAEKTTKVLAEILAGRYDGNLVEITEAIAHRLRSGETQLLWRIRLPDGETWDAETVTIGELRYVETVTGRSYLEINPGKSMTQFTALVAAHHRATHGMTIEAALEKAGGLTQQEAVTAVELYEGHLGKDSGATSS